jgi:hypothetical protein
VAFSSDPFEFTRQHRRIGGRLQVDPGVEDQPLQKSDSVRFFVKDNLSKENQKRPGFFASEVSSVTRWLPSCLAPFQ